MKLIPLFSSFGILLVSTSLGLGLLGIDISSANAHPTLRQTVEALSYPRSSQRFLEKGQAQLETEIEYLQQKVLALPPNLRTESELLHKQQFLRQQQERWLEEKLQ